MLAFAETAPSRSFHKSLAVRINSNTAAVSSRAWLAAVRRRRDTRTLWLDIDEF